MNFVVKDLRVNSDGYNKLMDALESAGAVWAAGQKPHEYTPPNRYVDIYLHGRRITFENTGENEEDGINIMMVGEAIEKLHGVMAGGDRTYTEDDVIRAFARVIAKENGMPNIITMALTLFVPKVLMELKKGDDDE